MSLWQTDVADTVICEYTSHTRLLATGTPYSNRYLGIFRFRDDGRLALWREFINPVTISDRFARAAADSAAAAPRAPVVTQSYMDVMNLVYAYPECIDAGDFEGVGRLFEHATVEMGPGNVLVGAAEVQASFERWTRRYPDDGTPHTRHTITNPIVTIDEDAGTASVRYYIHVLQRIDAFPLQPVWANRYEDHLARVDGRWRFVRRRAWGHMPGDTSHHLMGAPDATG